jgi:hypothetical protein
MDGSVADHISGACRRSNCFEKRLARAWRMMRHCFERCGSHEDVDCARRQRGEQRLSHWRRMCRKTVAGAEVADEVRVFDRMNQIHNLCAVAAREMCRHAGPLRQLFKGRTRLDRVGPLLPEASGDGILYAEAFEECETREARRSFNSCVISATVAACPSSLRYCRTSRRRSSAGTMTVAFKENDYERCLHMNG